MSPSGSGLFCFEWSVLIFTFYTRSGTVSIAETLILLFTNCSRFLKWMTQDVQGI